MSYAQCCSFVFCFGFHYSFGEINITIMLMLAALRFVILGFSKSFATGSDLHHILKDFPQYCTWHN